MITKAMKNSRIAFMTIVIVTLSSCSSGKNRLGMASEEGINKVKELVRAHVNPDENKIYRLQWKEDRDERKLDNILTHIDVDYIDKNDKDYSLSINLKDEEFVPDEPRKSPRDLYSYEYSTPIDLADITVADIQRMTQEGHDLFSTQEDAKEYEMKSVEAYVFYIRPVDKREIDLWKKSESCKAEHKELNFSFQLNYIKKDEQPEVRGRHTWTNYYTIPFTVNKEGKVEIKE